MEHVVFSSFAPADAVLEENHGCNGGRPSGRPQERPQAAFHQALWETGCSVQLPLHAKGHHNRDEGTVYLVPLTAVYPTVYLG